jgi:flagellar basal-body rod modification protein FlgD
MVDGVSNNSTTNTAANTSQTQLVKNFDTFLTLLTAQLKNQDPMAPLDTKDFTNQLVQFSQVEQQINMNSSLTKLISATNLNQQTQALDYIGKEVDAPGDTTYAAAGKGGQWTYELPKDASSVTLKVLDKAGNVVWTGTGDTATGQHEFAWDGKNSGTGEAAPAGNYTLKVEAKDAKNAAITADVTMRGKVDSVEIENGETMLVVGSTKIKLSDITGVHIPAAA